MPVKGGFIVPMLCVLSRLGAPLTVLTALFGVLMCLSVAAYFHANRPLRGTTEWIARLDPPQRRPLTVQRLRAADTLWLLLAALLAAALRFAYLFFALNLQHRENAAQILRVGVRFFASRLIPCAILAAALYLLLRLLFDQPLAALLCAALAGFTQNSDVAAAAMLAVSLLCLYLWMSAPPDAHLFFHALWLIPSALAYALALLACWQAAWLAPFYVGAYIVTQVRRFRGGDPARRVKKLVGSLLWLTAALLVWILLLWLAYGIISRRLTGGPLEILRSFSFYATLPATITQKLSELVIRVSLPETVLFGDVFVALAGAAALIPTLHGAVREKDSRCLWALCLLPCFLCMWLLGGAYLMNLPLLLALGWAWQRETERGCAGYAIGSFCAVLLCFGAERILH